MSKRRRLKAPVGAAVYHCMSRVWSGERLWDDSCKEAFRKQMWKCAEFSGVRIITYCLMSNHFHILIKVPDRQAVRVADEELIRRYEVLYPKRSPKQSRHAPGGVELLREQLDKGGEEAEAVRARLLARMHDVSEFMKALKQRFSIWYNRNHERFGTHWAERFRSVLVEGSPLAARTVAAYIDLNPVRAGLVNDPKDYRWCGYAEAVAGNRKAEEGMVSLSSVSFGPGVEPEVAAREAAAQGLWQKAPNDDFLPYSRLDIALAEYRMLLFGKGAAPGKAGDCILDREEALRVLGKEKGQLPLHALLRCRLRYFTDGLVFGSRDFVQGILDDKQRRGEIRLSQKPRVLPGADWQGLTAGRGLHKDAIS